MSTRLDHLVIAARTLEEGVQWCEATLGITPGPGGRHALMGTHNRLFSLASDTFPNAYGEIIAIDPAASPPDHPRWFGLDSVDLTGGPRLLTFVVRTTALDAMLAALRDVGVDGGRALAASRETATGLLRWRIAVRDDGAVLCGGAMPTLIEWGEQHPAASMSASGVVLRSLALRGVPRPPIAALGLDRATFTDTTGPAIEARLGTQRGPITLTSL